MGGARLGWDAIVLEQAGVGENLRQWGPTRFFSPLDMNLPPGIKCPLPGEAILTGAEFVDTVLEPMANSEALAGRVKTGYRVAFVGRDGMTRCDYPLHPVRAERGFRVLAEGPQGEEIFEAEAVIDASGTYGQPAWIGAGGVPAMGERALDGRIIRNLGALDEQLNGLDGRSALLVGHGDSAANAIVRLNKLSKVVWAVRTLNRRPCIEVACDPLPERQRVMAGANQLAMQPPGWLQVERRATVEALAARDNGQIAVNLSGGRQFLVDVVIALTGYRPDLSIVSELALRIDPVTEGAAGLARALANVTDCLSVPAVTPADLESGEPGFYLAGAKSYGRSRSFLLKAGYEQVKTILNRLNG